MAVSNELTKPESDDEFEAMCHQLYKRMWQDVSCVRVGRSGQSQSGVDILGAYGGKPVGVQCKHYNKKSFAMATIAEDIKKADDAGLRIDHLLFATTAGSDPKIIEMVRNLSAQRQMDGKFTVSIDYWGVNSTTKCNSHATSCSGLK